MAAGTLIEYRLALHRSRSAGSPASRSGSRASASWTCSCAAPTGSGTTPTASRRARAARWSATGCATRCRSGRSASWPTARRAARPRAHLRLPPRTRQLAWSTRRRARLTAHAGGDVALGCPVGRAAALPRGCGEPAVGRLGLAQRLDNSCIGGLHGRAHGQTAQAPRRQPVVVCQRGRRLRLARPLRGVAQLLEVALAPCFEVPERGLQLTQVGLVAPQRERVARDEPKAAGHLLACRKEGAGIGRGSRAGDGRPTPRVVGATYRVTRPPPGSGWRSR